MALIKMLPNIKWDLLTIQNLTHWGPDDAIWQGDLSQHGFKQRFAAWQHQAITWTTTDLLSIEILRTNYSEMCIKIQGSLLQENAFDNVTHKIKHILFRAWFKYKRGNLLGPEA